MRATAQDRDAAAMMGINVNRTISFTFLIAGALAGAGGLLYALYFGQVRYDTGFQLGLIAFTAAVLGGIGNLPGAVLGALCIGFIQAFNEGLTLALARQRLDAVDRLRDPDPDPRLPARGPARRTDAGGRLTMRRRIARRDLARLVGGARPPSGCRATRWLGAARGGRGARSRPSSGSRSACCSIQFFGVWANSALVIAVGRPAARARAVPEL